ncbi:hypothetical protein [Desulfolucanica intricata]|nr:hypothetical protein [Desulfolucanica intricata]
MNIIQKTLFNMAKNRYDKLKYCARDLPLEIFDFYKQGWIDMEFK